MLYLTAAAADVEQQASTFSRFLQQLTWQKALPALLILAVSLVLIRVLTALFDKAIRRSKIDPTIHPLLRIRAAGRCSRCWRCSWPPGPWASMCPCSWRC